MRSYPIERVAPAFKIILPFMAFWAMLMLYMAYQDGKQFNKQARKTVGVIVRIDSIRFDRESNYHRLAEVIYPINGKYDSTEFVDFNYRKDTDDTISVYYNPLNYQTSLTKSSFLDYYPLILFIIFCSSVWIWVMTKY